MKYRLAARVRELSRHRLPLGMDGYEALTHLKQHMDTRDIPVIALSADAMPSDIERGLQARFFRYLSKPFNIKQLMETLDETLKLTRWQY